MLAINFDVKPVSPLDGGSVADFVLVGQSLLNIKVK